MRSRILEIIQTLEQERNIKILYASETGSRARSIPFSDSDYDLHLVYVHPKDYYISLYEKKDSLSLIYEREKLDIKGWDLRKALLMLYRSHTSIIELIDSPIVYFHNESFTEELKALTEDLYSPVTAAYDYMMNARKALNELSGKQSVCLKALLDGFYAALQCNWLLEKSNRPAVSIYDLMNNLELQPRLNARARDLIQLKSFQKKDDLHNREEEIMCYIEEAIDKTEENTHRMAVAKDKSVDLNKTFVHWVNA